MYDTLLQLPLFQGLCKNDFTRILEKVTFHFHNYRAREIIVRQGDVCDRLIFLLDGRIHLQTSDLTENFRLSEIIDNPSVIEPYSVFGMKPYYTATYQAEESVKMLSIDKKFILSHLNHYEIFRINYLNVLSSRGQMLQTKLWNTHIGTLQEKFVNFLLLRSQTPKGEKTLYIGMENLSKLINETRINVSRLLNDLQEKGLIQLKRKEIIIPSLEKLTLTLK